MNDDRLLALLHETADAVWRALEATHDWGLAGTRPGQYHSDLAADAAAVEHLVAGGVGVLSEESGLHRSDRTCTVVIDPLDGSTNASRRVSWYATSLCAMDDAGPRAALVADLVHGVRYTAVRGRGAWRDHQPIRPSSCTAPGDAIVAVNGLPSHHFGWAQFRALGAAALDLCAVADGRLDAYLDLTADGLGPWDYLGALLVCQEAGAVVEDVDHRDLVVLSHDIRRSPFATATAALADGLRLAARNAPGSTPGGMAAAPP